MISDWISKLNQNHFFSLKQELVSFLELEVFHLNVNISINLMNIFLRIVWSVFSSFLKSFNLFHEFDKFWEKFCWSEWNICEKHHIIHYLNSDFLEQFCLNHYSSVLSADHLNAVFRLITRIRIFCSDPVLSWVRIRTEWDFFLMRWNRIRFYFHEMRQNWIFFCEMRWDKRWKQF